jgi:hypothetical protein
VCYERGRSLRVHPPSYCAPVLCGCAVGGGVFLLLHKASPGGEAFAYVRGRIAPHSSQGVMRKGAWGSLRVNPGLLLWIFGCTSVSCTGFFFDGRIITRKTQKSHRNTENKKNRLDGPHVVPSPVPHTEPTEINGIHEKGDRGGMSR